MMCTYNDLEQYRLVYDRAEQRANCTGKSQVHGWDSYLNTWCFGEFDGVLGSEWADVVLISPTQN